MADENIFDMARPVSIIQELNAEHASTLDIASIREMLDANTALLQEALGQLSQLNFNVQLLSLAMSEEATWSLQVKQSTQRRN
ncbi:MAG TPA: hypothetical protein V6C76_12690 [Drouetiella sp.]